MQIVSRWLAMAIEHHQKERHGDAERLYRRILRRDPDNPDALHFLGVARHQAGSSDEAVALIERAIERQPDLADAHNNLGRILAETGDTERAIECCQAAIRLRSDFADAWFNLGVCYRKAEDPARAIDALQRADELNPGSARTFLQLGRASNEADLSEQACYYYEKAIAADPAQTKAYESLGVLLYALGRTDDAAGVYRQWTKVDPHNPRAAHMYAACSDTEPPPRAADDYVVSVFDQFAGTFDSKLAKLQYRAPQLVADALRKVIAADTEAAILDAGCGTGLCGPLLRDLAARLDGVDLSPAMVQKAADRACYDTLAVAELTEFMQASTQKFDAVVSADTLVYFGDLSPPFAAAAAVLRPGGWLVFTVERLDEPDRRFALNPHGRYSHEQDYVCSELERSEFEVCDVFGADLRVENKSPARGLVVTARRQG